MDLTSGTYVMEVVGQNGTFLGQSTFAGADVLTESAGDAWARYLGQETRFLPKLTTIASNDTKNFSPLIFTTNIYTYTADNASFITGLANQLFNSTQYGVQVASCYPNFASVILSTPTVNIFAANETLPDYCTAIQLKAVCPPDAGFA
ncbi:hypothetical protein NW754_016190 [Fusarium falciforme]|nr:hypothetical protein NW754_016190 [Fusarium falciforme]